MFLKRQFPLIICFVVGVAMALQYYVPSSLSQKLGSQTSDWYIIISFARRPRMQTSVDGETSP